MLVPGQKDGGKEMKKVGIEVIASRAVFSVGVGRRKILQQDQRIIIRSETYIRTK